MFFLNSGYLKLKFLKFPFQTATERLVTSARQNVIEDERNIVISDRLVTGIAQVRGDLAVVRLIF